MEVTEKIKREENNKENRKSEFKEGGRGYKRVKLVTKAGISTIMGYVEGSKAGCK